MTFVKPNQGQDFYPFMLGSYNCVKTKYSAFPPQKDKFLATGIYQRQHGLLACGPRALAGLLRKNRVTQPPNFLLKVVFALCSSTHTSFLVVPNNSRRILILIILTFKVPSKNLLSMLLILTLRRTLTIGCW